MKIDLHIHTSTGSDGALTVEEVFQEAQKREIDVLSITDHDAIHHQGQAIQLARKYGIIYITGMELNVTFEYRHKSVSLDFLSYGYDYENQALRFKQTDKHLIVYFSAPYSYGEDVTFTVKYHGKDPKHGLFFDEESSTNPRMVSTVSWPDLVTTGFHATISLMTR